MVRVRFAITRWVEYWSMIWGEKNQAISQGGRNKNRGKSYPQRSRETDRPGRVYPQKEEGDSF